MEKLGSNLPKIDFSSPAVQNAAVDQPQSFDNPTPVDQTYPPPISAIKRLGA